MGDYYYSRFVLRFCKAEEKCYISFFFVKLDGVLLHPVKNKELGSFTMEEKKLH